jgi:hypothetical protein
MNTIQKKVIIAVIVSLLLNFSVKIYSQTAGSLTFSCSTTAPSGTWGNKHVLAIWIENTQNPSAFIKTKAKYGSQDDHLTAWAAKSGKNLVDATTGATLTSYVSSSVIWNGTGVNNVVVADGNYNVFIEMGWGSSKTSQHAVTSFTFNKGPAGVHLNPTGTSNYSNVVIDWVPLTTLVPQIKDSNSLTVYPNPTNGLLNLEIKQSIPSAKIIVVNTLGAVVYQKTIEDGFVGNLNIDLVSFTNGLYLLKVSYPEHEFVYKVILQK